MSKKLGLAFLLITLSACQAYNSSSGDDIKYSGDGTLFSDAKIVFVTRCASCHDFHTKTQLQLASEGLFTPGDLYGSSIYTRLKGAGGGDTEDMPVGSQLSAEELLIIRQWIEN